MTDQFRRYGRSKLGMILFGRQLVKRKLPSGPNTVIVTSVHPGTVDTGLSYGFHCITST
jgi:NAD(P)-dependent dehydrogenase (short-subunit alcohol dehydrogenase family)